MFIFLAAMATAGAVELFIILLVVGLWRVTEKIASAPWLDLVMACLTWLPWIATGTYGGWLALAGCVLGQFLAMQVFCFGHWLISGHRGPSIGATLNRLVGPISNNFALIATLPALPVFLSIRFAQCTTYPVLVKYVRLPAYRHADWVNVSRQKFSGLVGHDLVWCLYCDWMTGIYSLGAEMLRNLESFWCPIKFYPGKKCENCKLDFPDIEKWVESGGSMTDVQAILNAKYEGRPSNSWWSHPDRKS